MFGEHKGTGYLRTSSYRSCSSTPQPLNSIFGRGWQFTSRTTSSVSWACVATMYFANQFPDNSSAKGYIGAQWQFMVFDAGVSAAIVLAGNCTTFNPIFLSAVVSANDISIQQTTISDGVEAFVPAEVVAECQFDSNLVYNQYSLSVSTLPSYGPALCDLGNRDYTGPCKGTLTMSFSSWMITTQRSMRASDWKQMLLDEGAIVGGVMFVTWFLGIFVQ